jgi:hypothetical protein
MGTSMKTQLQIKSAANYYKSGRNIGAVKPVKLANLVSRPPVKFGYTFTKPENHCTLPSL